MIQVQVKFLCREYTGEMENGIYSLSDGSTIADLIAACEEQYKIRINDAAKNYLRFMVDSRISSWDHKLDDGQTVLVMRLVSGG